MKQGPGFFRRPLLCLGATLGLVAHGAYIKHPWGPSTVNCSSIVYTSIQATIQSRNSGWRTLLFVPKLTG